MKIAIPSLGNSIESLAESRFGRSAYFIVFDSHLNTFKSIENTHCKAVSGAGGQAVGLLSNEGVEVILLPEVGPKAMQAIKAFDIKAYRYVTAGPVTKIIEQYKMDELEGLHSESHEGNHKSNGLYRG